MTRIPRGFLLAARLRTLSVIWLVTAVLVLSGCSTEDSRVVALRQRLLLESEPATATTIATATASCEDQSRLSLRESSVQGAEVTIVGRIADDELEAFVPGQAVFLVTEILPEREGHAGDDHASNCPFCKRKAAEAPRAAVQFVDQSGAPLAVDARELFGIRPGDTVVVRGAGEVVAKVDMFQITADGIYIRPTGERR